MKNLAAVLVALALCAASSLLGQDITGTWQGTLKADRDLRIVLKISKADSGSLVWASSRRPRPTVPMLRRICSPPCSSSSG